MTTSMRLSREESGSTVGTHTVGLGFEASVRGGARGRESHPAMI